MPLSFSSRSFIRSSPSSSPLPLVLRVTHNLEVAVPNELTVHRILPSLSSSVDVFLPPSGNLDIRFTGSVNGMPPSAHMLNESALLSAVVEALSCNAASLGLGSATKSIVAEDVNIHLRFATSISPACTYSPKPLVALASLILDFCWGSREKLLGSSAEVVQSGVGPYADVHDLRNVSVHPFADHLMLPFRNVFQQTVDKLLRSLMRRYPLIFNCTYIETLKLECGLFPSVATSLSRILGRSRDAKTRQQGKELLQKLSQQSHNAVVGRRSGLLLYLRTHCALEVPDCANEYQESQDGDVTVLIIRKSLLVLCMSRIRPQRVQAIQVFSSGPSGEEIENVVSIDSDPTEITLFNNLSEEEQILTHSDTDAIPPDSLDHIGLSSCAGHDCLQRHDDA